MNLPPAGILLVLVDGLGLGEPDEGRNPLAVARTRWFRCFRNQIAVTDGCLVVPTDASLGVPGLPQSATGQTALLTGLNAPLLAGRHIQGFCTPTLSSLLAEHSLFRTFSLHGGRVACANAFPASILQRHRFPSVTTVAARTAGIRLRDLDDLTRGQALHHDFTNHLLKIRGHSVPPLSAEEAAQRLAEITAEHDLTYYEYIQTDLAGHAQDMDRVTPGTACRPWSGGKGRNVSFAGFTPSQTSPPLCSPSGKPINAARTLEGWMHAAGYDPGAPVFFVASQNPSVTASQRGSSHRGTPCKFSSHRVL